MFDPFPELTAVFDAIKLFCVAGAVFFGVSTAVTVIRFLRDFNQETK